MLPAIVIVSYNRPDCLKRLLRSIKKANYSNYNHITLMISIDGGGCYEMKKIADDFIWQHGLKKVICHESNLGLRKHVISCGDLINEFESLIMLEEDCFVSLNFYDYAVKALNFYTNDDSITGISLYAYNYNENAGLPFTPLKDGNCVYFMQIPSSWGQIWTKNQWKKFKEFYNKECVIVDKDLLPEYVKKWPESSWKKYFYKYMVEQNLFFVYPQTSLTTNFGDIGTHFQSRSNLLQVPLDNRMESTTYSFIKLESSFNKYDAYFEILPDCLIKFGIKIDLETGIDLFGTKQLSHFNKKYFYSIKDCRNPIKTFSMDLTPLIQNVINEQAGEGISFALADDFTTVMEEKRKILLKNSNSTIFDFAFNKGLESGYNSGRYEGFNEGKKAGMDLVHKSTSFRLGQLFIRPFHFMKTYFANGTT